MMSMADAITAACEEIGQFLLAKNRAYGNSAAEPVRVFSKADPLEQINVRMDDKLSRMIKGEGYPGDDDMLDLEGYMVLRRAIKIREGTCASEPSTIITHGTFIPQKIDEEE